MKHFVMVDFNKGINIIKHNFLKRVRNFGHSATVLHAAEGKFICDCAKYSSKYARSKNNYNFNAQHSINILYFIVIIAKKYAENWYQLLY